MPFRASSWRPASSRPRPRDRVCETRGSTRAIPSPLPSVVIQGQFNNWCECAGLPPGEARGACEVLSLRTPQDPDGAGFVLFKELNKCCRLAGWDKGFGPIRPASSACCLSPSSCPASDLALLHCVAAAPFGSGSPSQWKACPLKPMRCLARPPGPTGSFGRETQRSWARRWRADDVATASSIRTMAIR